MNFVSEGPKGKLIKFIQFQEIEETTVCNVAFGDLNPSAGELDNKIVTDNGDSEKGLATVVAAVYMFTKRYPDAWVDAVGSLGSCSKLLSTLQTVVNSRPYNTFGLYKHSLFKGIGQGKYYMKVWHRQQFCFSCLYPFFTFCFLALRAMPVTASIADTYMSATIFFF